MIKKKHIHKLHEVKANMSTADNDECCYGNPNRTLPTHHRPPHHMGFMKQKILQKKWI